MTDEVQKLLKSGEVSLCELKPSEVELVTGLSPEMQRLWRRRGFLDRKDASRASFDVLEVAAILTAVPLAKHGYSPGAALEVGRKYQHRVFQLAILEVDGAIELNGGNETVEKFVGLMSGASAFPITAYLSGNVNGEQATLLRSCDGLPVEGVFEHPDRDFTTDEFLATFTIDLVKAGSRLGNRVGRPLVRVEFSSERGEKRPKVRKVLEAKKAV